MITIAKIKKWSKTHPEMLPALFVLPFSSILAALVWLLIRFWPKRKNKQMKLSKDYHMIHRVGLLETYCFAMTGAYRYAYLIQIRGKHTHIMYGDHLSKYAPIDEIIEEAKRSVTNDR